MWSDVSGASIALLAVFLVLSAFFSGSEAALLSVQRVRLRRLVNEGSAGAKRVERMIEAPERLLPPILLGNNLVNTGAAAVGAGIAITLIADENLALAAATAAVTALLLVFGETIPKTVAARHAERAAILVAPVIQAVGWVLKPVSLVLQAISLGIARLFGGSASISLVTEEEIKTMVEVGSESGAVEHEEAAMIRRVLEFGDRRVSEVMTPRPEVVSVGHGATIREFLALYAAKSHTRFPVVRGELDNVAGMIGVKGVMRQLADGADPGEPAAPEARPTRFVPETKRVDELFNEMRVSGDQIAMVVDEYGGVAGLVTFKRLVEGIVGKVEEDDAGRAVEQDIEIMDEATAEVDGGLSVTDANEQLSLGLPAGQYETVAGFLLQRLGRIPEEGAEVSYGALRFSVLEMRGVRIGRVRVTRSPASPEE